VLEFRTCDGAELKVALAYRPPSGTRKALVKRSAGLKENACRGIGVLQVKLSIELRDLQCGMWQTHHTAGQLLIQASGPREPAGRLEC
jgi:hypothetical protein